MVDAAAYDTVLFDLDGTVTDPRVGITRAVQRGLAEVGIDADSLLASIGPPLHDSFVEHHGVAVVGARAAGLASIGVTWGYARPGELEAAGADRIVSSVAELATARRGG